MKKQQKWMLVLAVMGAFIATVLFLPGLTGAGELEPGNTPGPTMHTLEEIYNKLIMIEKKLDGIIGIRRFIDMGDGTVLDSKTGLFWLKNVTCLIAGGSLNWDHSKAAAAVLNDGECGLSDGSSEGDWRVPTLGELQEIGTDPPITWSADNMEPPPANVVWTNPGRPTFENLYNQCFWTSTEDEEYPNEVDLLCIDSGVKSWADKDETGVAWPVRNGN